MNRMVPPVLLVVCWSSGFVGAALAAQHAPAGTSLLWRYVAGAAVTGAVVVALGRRYSASYLRREAVLGLLAQVGYLYGVFRAADDGLSAATSALVASLQPVLVAGVLAAGGRRRARGEGRRESLGLGIGLLGVSLVVAADLDITWSGLLWICLGTLCLTAATVADGSWPAPEGHDVLDSLAVQSVVACGVFAGLALLGGVAVPPASGGFWLAMLWLTVLSFLGGFGSYYWVLRTSGPVAASAWLYLTPGVSAVWALLMFDQDITAWAVVGLVVSALGVATVLPGRSRARHGPGRDSVAPCHCPRRSSTTTPSRRPTTSSACRCRG